MSQLIDAIAWVLVSALIVAAGMSSAHGQLRVLDGDTFDAGGERIRIRGVDTPEMRGPERELAQAAKGELERLLKGGYQLQRTGKDKYGRTVADVIVGGKNVALTLIESGHGRAYPYRLRKAEAEAVKIAEATAKKQKVGIWAKVK